MTIRTLLPVLFTLPSICSASFEALTLTRKVTDGRTELCYAQLGEQAKRCVPVESVDRAMTSTDADLKVVKLLLDEAGISHRADGTTEFGAIVSWEGLGHGLLSISGPSGRLFTLGHIVRDQDKLTVHIDHLCDESMAEQFSRGTLFGESDPVLLHARTQIWLEESLAPALLPLIPEASDEVTRP